MRLSSGMDVELRKIQSKMGEWNELKVHGSDIEQLPHACSWRGRQLTRHEGELAVRVMVARMPRHPPRTNSGGRIPIVRPISRWSWTLPEIILTQRSGHLFDCLSLWSPYRSGIHPGARTFCDQDFLSTYTGNTVISECGLFTEAASHAGHRSRKRRMRTVYLHGTLGVRLGK